MREGEVIKRENRGDRSSTFLCRLRHFAHGVLFFFGFAREPEQSWETAVISEEAIALDTG